MAQRINRNTRIPVQWERSKTSPTAVFVHYGTDPDYKNGSCDLCVFYRTTDCAKNPCDNGYYITLERAVAIKMES
jgi:hypothetical protein